MKLMQLCVGMVRTNCYIVYDEATREAAVCAADARAF